ncbi:MAG TPA: HEAT repeat domain-containing protein [Acidimicrobiales bacterium]|nr:HEAT repeat domain-containing protein [Acidimicrobiales bacterium]
MAEDDRTVADTGVTDRALTAVAARRSQAAVAGHEGDEGAARSLLRDPDPTVRSTALGALTRMGAATDDDVRRALTDTDPSVRRRALADAVARPSVPIVAALDDTDPTVVEQAAWACGEREDAGGGALDALVRVATSHDDALCREAAVAALGAIGDPAGLDAILAATHDRATVRRRAVIALAPFEGPEVDAALARATSDRDWQVRQAAEDLLDES